MCFKTFFNWSTGKDSALALHRVLTDASYNVEQLVTTLNLDTDRVSMHGIRRELLLKQVEQIGIPISIISLPGDTPMHIYDQLMRTSMLDKKQQGFTHAVFGDIFLEDLKRYRIGKLESVGLQAHFPLWKEDTYELMNTFIDLGFKAITVAVNAKVLDQTMVGRVVDKSFLKMLPKEVDPCGENGEFHTFVYDGPIFKKPVDFLIGEKILKTYGSTNKAVDDDHDATWDSSFWFCDLYTK